MPEDQREADLAAIDRAIEADRRRWEIRAKDLFEEMSQQVELHDRHTDRCWMHTPSRKEASGEAVTRLASEMFRHYSSELPEPLDLACEDYRFATLAKEFVREAM